MATCVKGEFPLAKRDDAVLLDRSGCCSCLWLCLCAVCVEKSALTRGLMVTPLLVIYYNLFGFFFAFFLVIFDQAKLDLASAVEEASGAAAKATELKVKLDAETAEHGETKMRLQSETAANAGLKVAVLETNEVCCCFSRRFRCFCSASSVLVRFPHEAVVFKPRENWVYYRPSGDFLCSFLPL